MSQRIGFIGTGVMGLSMASRLLDAGHPLTVFTRTRARAEPLLARGAAWADSPAEVARQSDVVISIVGYPHDVEETYLGPRGILTVADPVPPLLIDMTTSSPDLAVRIAKSAVARKSSAIDAPVSGGDIGARNGTLSIMLGGDASAVDRARPILAHLGSRLTHMGPPGAGQHTKMVNQILIATMMIGVSEGLTYAARAGLDQTKVIEAVGAGAAGSWAINNLGPRIIRRDFEPGFYVEHFLKDLRIALDEARRMNLCLPGLALAEQLYQSLQSRGLGRKGTQALALVIEQLSGQVANP